MSAPGSLDQLIEALRCLPGVGPKSAQRMAYHLLQRQRPGAQRLADALAEALSRIRHCQRCNTFTEDDLCERCASGKRDSSLLCVVEMPVDLNMMEQTHAFKGLYYVLMGRLSPLDGIGPKELGLERLLERATDGVVREVVMATNFTNEGEATAHYLKMQADAGAQVLKIFESWAEGLAEDVFERIVIRPHAAIIEKVRAAGITIPIVPGIMPVTNFNGLKKMSQACQTAVPTWLANLFEGLDNDAETRRLIACSVAAEMCAKLQEQGFEDFHFYTLNRADLVYAICRVLGVREPETTSSTEVAA